MFENPVRMVKNYPRQMLLGKYLSSFEQEPPSGKGV